ncbi:MAG: zinc metalloprotease HtpX [Bdellovibrionales bacterium RIFOXYD12_FULL_39_22]|nr:MAG: zinc metalloprotease HtpX [Bdellovibrionales bacterium RIFOXYB1_FULL_39_21]OFZ42364.1 MAG: zinc metalloprotease HtpX [Bdellovibrionales bacterium RIFOXYC12_FULL_39_17]OFZ46335.1 MAG: zinc metalloprotease HtpX [Bdellovibrionales bacterium RIFOXYC1_FULL_39_130]OFZ73126.1 MAG: zinc metalloprotease HtpX [Bdellovibrionales bacterium RIFOXYC2_FULL_39_8]OFZ75228.1 MAG: zinc metalloprotease HtpX [Bdellovibrionales bacterium RIFOXYD1_FULL_39_84]OFZ93222.1 MAG: zinc metalloprotease HtpX [Bdellov
MFRTIFLGLLVNIAIMAVLSLIIEVFGLNQILYYYLGGGYPQLFAICLFWGMGGAFISLLLSKWMAKTFHGVEILSPTGPQSALVLRVHNIAKRAGMNTMPEVGVFRSHDVNAFATGRSKDDSLVALSTALLERMDNEEVDGVIGHEVAHIVNGDMVTMTIIQGVVNAFVMFFAYVVAEIISNATRRNDDNGRGLGGLAHYFLRQMLMTVFGILAYPIVAWFSRAREYRADAGSAQFVSKNSMVKALNALKRAYPQIRQAHAQDESVLGQRGHAPALNISNQMSWAEIMSTHPPLEKRIAALNGGR